MPYIMEKEVVIICVVDFLPRTTLEQINKFKKTDERADRQEEERMTDNKKMHHVHFLYQYKIICKSPACLLHVSIKGLCSFKMFYIVHAHLCSMYDGVQKSHVLSTKMLPGNQLNTWKHL